MKKLLFVWVAIAMGVVLVPGASADTLIFNHLNDTYTLDANNPADQGSNVSLVNAFIENNSANESLAITGFEYYLGGNAVSGAAADTPSEFLSAENGWTYKLGAGDYGDETGTGWSKNKSPKAKEAVAPKDSSKTDYLSEVTLENSSSSSFCYTGEILTPGSECDVELLVTANFGGAEGSSSSTFIYGYAEGVDGKGTYNPITESWSKGSDATVAQGMEESIDITISPEPNSLVLLSTGCGLLGFGLVLRKRYAGSESSMSRSTIA